MTDFRKLVAKATSGDSSGTAFLISPEHAITAAHVIQNGNGVDAELTFYNIPTPVKIKGVALFGGASTEINFGAFPLAISYE